MDNSKWNELIKEHSKLLTGFCLKLCGNRNDAEDLFQETWIKIIKGINTYDKNLPFDRWLLSVCANTYKNFVRYNKSRPTPLHMKTTEENDILLNNIEDKSLNRDMFDFELRDMIEKLNCKQKTVLILYYISDYSIKDIAQMLDIPDGTVKFRLHQAKKMLYKELKKI